MSIMGYTGPASGFKYGARIAADKKDTSLQSTIAQTHDTKKAQTINDARYKGSLRKGKR